MQNQQFDGNKRKRTLIMIALIVIPFLLAAFLWWVLPSGYGAHIAKKEKISGRSDFWHPLQPAIKLGYVILKPYQ
jgi:hypothetical protein